MKIVVLEKVEMTEEQAERLDRLGDVVERFDGSNEEECKKRIRDADVVVVDWIDPSPFILSMKSPSLLALMSTGYSWVKHLAEARQRGILVSNVPGYSTEAVAEHIIGLALSVARKTLAGDRDVRAGKKSADLRGIELKGRRMGVIGLGRVGRRVADISRCIGMEAVTYNRNKKSYGDVKDVTLDELLSSSDVICVSCQLNEHSRGMLNKNKLRLAKQGAIIVGATGGVVVWEDLVPLLKSGHLGGVGYDVFEGEEKDVPHGLLGLDNAVLTPHTGYNTVEAKVRQADICISNIEAFKKGKPTNIVN